jgi:atypical dual specificity phosphatase
MNKHLKFSWVIEGRLAGCAKPYLKEDLEFLYAQGIRALVRLEEGGFEAKDVIKASIEDLQEPIPDFTAPSQKQIDRIVQFIKSQLAEGKPLAVSCGAGIGRTGTILTCYLISECYSLEDAKSLIITRGRKPYEEDTGQEKAIKKYAKRKGVLNK